MDVGLGVKPSFSRGGKRDWNNFPGFQAGGRQGELGLGNRGLLGSVTVPECWSVCLVAKPEQSLGGKDKVGAIWEPLSAGPGGYL